MQAVIPFPNISPELFSIDLGGFSFALRWYALAYIAGILIGWRIALMAVRRPRLWPRDTAPVPPEAVEELVTAVILGIVIGGRLGFVLFYQPGYYLQNPLDIVKVWQGGMSFHGGMIGVALAGLLFLRKHRASPLAVLDLLAIAVPPGLLLGRIANFINAELWGRPSTLPWAVIFPGERAQDCPGVEGACARHPSQLYEAGLEGLVLGGLLLWLAFRAGGLKRPGLMTGVFLTGYALARMFVELFRQADPQFITPDNPWGYVVQFGAAGLSMGQLLSLPMLLLGLGLIWWSRRRT
ncbi:MAG: prolipoprotein diacylglyceryl transferase [Tranquillimonas sp.]|jgi:phosphatidylglycerol:prolipoprotein diacylglycerol transferase